MKPIRYWLRGGIVFAVIFCIPVFISMLPWPKLFPIFEYPGNNFFVFWFVIIFWLLLNKLFYPVYLLQKLLPIQLIGHGDLGFTNLHSPAAILFGGLIYFIIGALFGWLYGKIKNRNT